MEPMIGKRLLAAVVVSVMGAGWVAGAAGAAPMDRVTICHGTPNKYVIITPNASSFKDGHLDDGVVPGTSHGENNLPDLYWDGYECGGDGETPE